MSNPWAIALILLALVVAAMSRGIPRAWLWLAAGGLSFSISSLYWDYGDRSLHPILTLTCDAMVCSAVHLLAKEKWELGIFLAFMTSVFCSLLMIMGLVNGGRAYASLLELCNLSALLWIGGIGLLDLIGKHQPRAFYDWRIFLHSARHSVR